MSGCTDPALACTYGLAEWWVILGVVIAQVAVYYWLFRPSMPVESDPQ